MTKCFSSISLETSGQSRPQLSIIAHFDPLRTVEPKAMDTLTCHEFFKRMAATRDTFNLLSVLNDTEVTQVESFLKTLSFD